MLEDQGSQSEHDNDCGDNTEQEEDKDSMHSQEEKVDKKKKGEVGPMDLEIEFILGERWPTNEEYWEWLEKEEVRKNPERVKEARDTVEDITLQEKKMEDE